MFGPVRLSGPDSLAARYLAAGPEIIGEHHKGHSNVAVRLNNTWPHSGTNRRPAVTRRIKQPTDEVAAKA